MTGVASSARDRAIEAVRAAIHRPMYAGESTASNAVDALLANPEALRALAGVAGAPATPPADDAPTTPHPEIVRVNKTTFTTLVRRWFEEPLNRDSPRSCSDVAMSALGKAERAAADWERMRDPVRLVPAAATTPADARLLDMDRDGAIEAAADALAEMSDPEDGGGEFAYAAVTAALDYLSSQSYPVTLGPARRTEEGETNGR